MGRPRKKNPKVHVNLSLSPSARELGLKLSYESDESLSEMVERLLEAENSSRSGLLASTHLVAEEQAPYEAGPTQKSPAVSKPRAKGKTGRHWATSTVPNQANVA